MATERFTVSLDGGYKVGSFGLPTLAVELRTLLPMHRRVYVRSSHDPLTVTFLLDGSPVATNQVGVNVSLPLWATQLNQMMTY
jgi:hypothetical protein